MKLTKLFPVLFAVAISALCGFSGNFTIKKKEAEEIIRPLFFFIVLNNCCNNYKVVFPVPVVFKVVFSVVLTFLL